LFDAGNTLQKIKRQFEKAIDRQFKIDYKPPKLTVNMRESELWSIAVNLLHNAITSGEYTHERTSKKAYPPLRSIKLEVYASDDAMVLVVEDDGPGLPADRPSNWIWELFSSSRGQGTEDDEGGSGIGLWIVSDLVIGLGGTAVAGPSKSFETGARFEIVIPKVVAQ
jgi:C4-dicarboxylate-specific signal transduction histidine kinase